jgi:hypothetical protein
MFYVKKSLGNHMNSIKTLLISRRLRGRRFRLPLRAQVLPYREAQTVLRRVGHFPYYLSYVVITVCKTISSVTIGTSSPHHTVIKYIICIYVLTYIPRTLYPRRDSRVILDIPSRYPCFTKIS